MVKTTIKETTEKYDGDGRLIEKITREETSEDDTDYYPSYTVPIAPVIPTPYVTPNSGKIWGPSWYYEGQDMTVKLTK